MFCFFLTANERAVQATSKKVAVKQGLQNVKISLLLTGKSIKRVPYRFRKAHFSKKFRRGTAVNTPNLDLPAPSEN